GLMHLIQALVSLENAQNPEVAIVTHGAAPVGGPPRAELAPLWALTNVIASEHYNLKCRCFDLDEDLALEPLFHELVSSANEAQVAIREGLRYVARLMRSRPLTLPTEVASTTLRADATYLISGGLGGLGLAVAQDLVEHGA